LRNLKPFQLILLGSGGLAVVVAALLLLVAQVTDLDYSIILWLPITIGAISFVIFFVLVRQFITGRIKDLYRAIRKGKYTTSKHLDLDLRKDIISNVEQETKQWTDERIAEISQLKEQEEFRREFLGNLAHELKTPVFSIQGYILTLLEGGLEDESINRQFLMRASKATDRMTDILEDLDQIAKMEVNELHLETANFDIVELAQDTFDDLEMKAKKAEIKLKFASEYTPIMVHGDRSRIGQIFVNLISNSISYGKEGGTTTVSFGNVDGKTSIRVSDDGLGISEEHLPRLFERFYRVEKSRNRHMGGSGLGLAIVKHIIEAHNQTITVDSTSGLGSEFTFTLDKAKK